MNQTDPGSNLTSNTAPPAGHELGEARMEHQLSLSIEKILPLAAHFIQPPIGAAGPGGDLQETL